MNNILKYKDYHTKIECNIESKKFFGKIEGIQDLVNFQCEDFANIENEFHAAVDDYLDFCAEVGKIPDKEYKGSFNVRISPKLHRKLALFADRKDKSLNHVVEKAIEVYTD